MRKLAERDLRSVELRDPHATAVGADANRGDREHENQVQEA
jgi:hypothetical protein